MAKKILTIKAKCVVRNERENNSNVLLAVDMGTTDKGPTARKVFNYQTVDAKETSAFEIGKTYTITVEGE